jgi:hypothetical protein
MSATLERPAPPLVGERGRPTLEQALERPWRDLLAEGTAECPLCHASMTLAAGEGECSGCGSRLS